MLRRRLMSSNSGDGRFMIGRYEVVDLGLSNGLLFATCNVGANEEIEYGNYYKYGYGSTTYAPTESYYSGSENPLSPNADTATQEMGEIFRTPTLAELQDLLDKTDYEWVTNFNGSGINGGKFTSKTNPNAYVFFPASGTCYSYSGTTSTMYLGTESRGWCSTPSYTLNNGGWCYRFDKDDADYYNAARLFGFPVRGVIDSESLQSLPINILVNLFVEVYPETSTVTSFVPNTDFEVICIYNDTFKTLYKFKAGTSYPIISRDGSHYILYKPDEKVMEIGYENYSGLAEVTVAVVFPDGYDGQEVIGTFNDGTEYITQGGSSLYTLEINGQNFICSYDGTFYNGDDACASI